MTVTRNVIANYLGRAYSIASLYLFTPLYIKYLGLPAYGVIGFYTIILTLGALIDAGLTATLSREAARSRDRTQLLDLSTTIERVLLLGTLGFAVLVCLLAGPIAQHWLTSGDATIAAALPTAIRLMALTVPAQLGISLYVGGLLGLQRQGAGNGVLALYVTVRGGMVIPFIAYNPSLELFFAWQLGSSWMMLLLARAIYLRSLRFPVFASGTASFAALRPLLHFAGGMFALTILSALTMQIDKVIVSKLFPLDQFAIYSLASTISQLPYSLVAPLMLAMLPRLTEMISKGMDREASELYDRFVVLVAVVAGAGSAGLALFAPEVLQLWLQLDKVPDGAVALVRILSLGWLLFTLAATPFHLGMAYGHSRTSVVTGFASAAVAIPMLILLSRTVGLAGAAMPWVMINIASFLALNWNIHRRFYRGPARPGWVSLIAALGAGVVVGAARVLTSWLQLEPLAACAMAAGVIIGATLIFGAFYRKTLRAWFAPS